MTEQNTLSISKLQQADAKAAEINAAEAQFRLALCCFEGKGAAKDYGLGMKWMIAATAQGYAEAIHWLTNAYIYLAIPSCYLDKSYVEKYYKFVFDWCKKETHGHMAVEAWLMLGILSFSGKGTEQNDAYALECFQHAREAFSDSYDFNRNEYIEDLICFYRLCCEAKINGTQDIEKLELYPPMALELGQMLVEGIMVIPYQRLHQNRVFLILLQIAIYKEAGEYEQAKTLAKEAFDTAMDQNLKEVCLINIDQEQEIAEKNKALHEKEKEMLSFFTHTMRNALATAPESLRQAIRLLGSEDYESNQKHYKAINKIAALFSTLSLTDCLIDTFKQSISEPEEFQRAWQNDHQGEATPKWVIAAALRQSLNRIIFMSDTSELRQLLNNADIPAIVAMRKSFIDNILPLNLDNQGITAFYQWLSDITSLEIAIEDHDLHFGVNQVKFSLLFAISSELILNALKYWNGSGKIQIRWYTEQEQFIFKVTNACETNASSSLAGTHKGITFIKRLMELLGEHAQFNCSVEEQLFTAELKLHQSLLESNR